MMTVRAAEPAAAAPDPVCAAAREIETARSASLNEARGEAEQARPALASRIARLEAALVAPPSAFDAELDALIVDVRSVSSQARRAADRLDTAAGRADSAAAFRARRCAAPVQVAVEISRHEVVERYVSLRVPSSAAERMDYELHFDAEGRLTRLVNAPQSGFGELAEAIGESGAALASFHIDFQPGGAILQTLGGPSGLYATTTPPPPPPPPPPVPVDPVQPRVSDVLEEERARARSALAALDRAIDDAETAGEALPPPQPALPFIRVFDPTDPASLTELHAALWANSLPLLVRVERQGIPSNGPRLWELADADEDFVGVLVRESLDYAVRVSQLDEPGEFVMAMDEAAAAPEIFRDEVSCALGFEYDGYCDFATPRKTRTYYADLQAFPNEGAVRTLPIWRNAWADTTTTVDFAEGSVSLIDSERPAPATEPFRASSRLLNGFVTSLTGNLQSQNALARERSALMEEQIRLLEAEARLQTAIDEAEAARLAREEAQTQAGSPD